ncbi:threonine/serine exporter family protein [Isobaculum melis]|uniref:Uncharacterized membrane protein YjjB, DUF3815 family n=1 Tax=Isobaculum melis TaxID=142588 RepID=A0A1H9THA9_9LACT|nr:threonine/serine exporter family protein [Isobaculum melis]SER96582.1 Uncharacterized membrane protein YjjB, DUF3815 family [Isobaculum melis]
MEIILQALFSFIGVVAFGVLTNVPRTLLQWCGAIGTLSWLVYYLLINFGVNIFISYFISAMMIRLGSLILAKIKRVPSTMFSIPSLVTVVPGGTAYQMIRYFAVGESNLGIGFLMQVIGIAVAISVGFLIANLSFEKVKTIKVLIGRH